MATEITMPKLSDTMTEGRLISWKKSVGEKVSRGDIIAEVETDKANMELEAFVSGVLLETRVKPGEMAPVGTVIALVGEAGEGVQAQAAKEAGSLLRESGKPRPESATPVEAAPPAAPAPRPEEGAEAVEKEKASPMVRRLARERGIDLRMVKGSGQDGRILKEDLEPFLKGKQVEDQVQDQTKARPTELQAESEPATEPEQETRPTPPGESRPLSRMRAAIARIVGRSWREIPHFSVTVAIDMGEAEEVRRELNGAGTHVSISDMIVKASAMALRRFPALNDSFAGEAIAVNGEINIGLAVALEDGLVVPVIKGCDALSLKQIGEKSGDMVARARNGKISEADLSGGTFTISNLGMFGVEEFTAVILPPQGGILATGGVSDEAMVKNGRLVAGRVMHATLSADHRLVDGAYAAQFLGELKKVLENPATMLV